MQKHYSNALKADYRTGVLTIDRYFLMQIIYVVQWIRVTDSFPPKIISVAVTSKVQLIVSYHVVSH